MQIFEYLSRFRYPLLRQTFFRRELESLYHSGKPYSLPMLNDDLRNTIRNRIDHDQRFFAERVNLFFSQFPDEIEKLRSSADAVLRGEYSFWGKFTFSVDDDELWSYSPDSKPLPKNFSWKLDDVISRGEYELAVPYLLGRLNQLVTLAIACQYRNEPIYREKYAELLVSFHQNNPLGFGIQWRHPNEIAVRLINLIISYRILGNAGLEKNSFLIEEMILLHLIYLDHVPEIPTDQEADPFIIALAFISAGAVMRGNDYGDHILARGSQRMEILVRRDVNPDGLLRSYSTAEFSRIAEALLYADIFLKNAGVPFSRTAEQNISTYLAAFADRLHTAGSFPNFGSAPIGRIVSFLAPPEQNQPASLAASIALHKAQPQLTQHNTQFTLEHYLFFHPEQMTVSANRNRPLTINKSAGYKNSGYYFLRHNDIDLAFSALDHRPRGHQRQHHDLFSFELKYKDRSFIVDAGEYSHYTNIELCSQQRSLGAHNTFSIDHHPFSQTGDKQKRPRTVIRSETLDWRSDNEEDKIIVQHYAYIHSVDPVICRRTVEFFKYKDRLEITDDLVGGLEHIIFSNLHLHHGVCIERIEPLSYMLSQGDVNLKLSFLIKQTVFELTLGEYLHSPHYQCSQPAKKFHLRYRDKLPSSYKIIFEFL